MLFKSSGQGNLEVSVESFWKSFFAAVICFPGVYFFDTLQTPETASPIDPFATLLIYTLFYVISWLVYPVFMHALLVLHNKEENFRLFIIGYNWLQVWQIAFWLCLHTIILSGLLDQQLAEFLGFFGMLYILATQTYMTKTIIETNWLSATAFVIFNVILAFSIYEFNNKIIAP